MISEKNKLEQLDEVDEIFGNKITLNSKEKLLKEINLLKKG
ncbi:hypothetical protein ACT7DO_08270 [Bacillus pacificus]